MPDKYVVMPRFLIKYSKTISCALHIMVDKKANLEIKGAIKKMREEGIKNEW